MDNLKEILNKIGYNNLVDFGNHYRTDPLYRDFRSHNSLAIKKDTGQWYDFSEKQGGHLATLVQKTLKLNTFDEAKQILIDGNIDVEKKVESHVSLIVSQKTFDKCMLDRLIRKHDYWQKRGISNDTMTIFHGGITFNGRMTGRYVFPIFNDKVELVGFAGRLLQDNPEYPKWKLIGKKSEWTYPLIYNKKHILDKNSVILVESIGDMLALWECGIKNVLVIFGVELNEKMIEFLLKIDIKKIIIALNNDSEKGMVGNKAAIDIKKKLSRYFDEEQVVSFSPKKKDFNDWLLEDKEGLINFCNTI